MRRTSLSLVITLLALGLLAGAALAAQVNFRGHMQSGDILNLPPGVESTAQGQALFMLEEGDPADPSDDFMTYKINVANLDQIRMAHIHRNGPPGANGPIMVWLYPSTAPGPGAPTGRIDGTLIEGVIYPGNVVGGFTWAQLIEYMRTDMTYVNVHTVPAPGGEINGHIH